MVRRTERRRGREGVEQAIESLRHSQKIDKDENRDLMGNMLERAHLRGESQSAEDMRNAREQTANVDAVCQRRARSL
jgi:hypothetical protein